MHDFCDPSLHNKRGEHYDGRVVIEHMGPSSNLEHCSVCGMAWVQVHARSTINNIPEAQGCNSYHIRSGASVSR